MALLPEKEEKQTTSPKAAPEPKGKGKAKREKNKDKNSVRRGNTFLLIIIILILASIITMGAIFMFNFAGLRAETSMWLSDMPVVGKLLRPIVENKDPEQIAKEEIALGWSKLAVSEKEISERIKELDQREMELKNKERELSDKELQINDMLEKLSSKLTSIEEQIGYLEKFDDKKALQIIMSMDDKETVVQLLRNMKKEKASAILGLMDPLQAAQLLEALTDQNQLGENSAAISNP